MPGYDWLTLTTDYGLSDSRLFGAQAGFEFVPGKS